jgi:transposase
MDLLYQRCCGRDVHKKSVVACLIGSDPDGTPHQTIRTCTTMTTDLVALADWLSAAGCTTSQGQHLACPGCRSGTCLRGGSSSCSLTPVIARLFQDATRRCATASGSLTSCGMGWCAAAMFPSGRSARCGNSPGLGQRSLRERTAEAKRLQKTRAGAHTKLAALATDILGSSGRALLQAWRVGTLDATALAQLAKGRMRDKIPELEQAVVGSFGSQQRFMVAQQLAPLDAVEAASEQGSAEITARLPPFETAVERLEASPGIGRYVAEALVEEGRRLLSEHEHGLGHQGGLRVCLKQPCASESASWFCSPPAYLEGIFRPRCPIIGMSLQQERFGLITPPASLESPR